MDLPVTSAIFNCGQRTCSMWLPEVLLIVKCSSFHSARYWFRVFMIRGLEYIIKVKKKNQYKLSKVRKMTSQNSSLIAFPFHIHVSGIHFPRSLNLQQWCSPGFNAFELFFFPNVRNGKMVEFCFNHFTQSNSA